MPNPVFVNVDLPADNADVLNGTILDPVPGPGSLIIWIASSQRDGVLSVTGALEGTSLYKAAPVLRANGIPDISADVPIVLRTSGGKVKIDYDEVTAGDAFAVISFVRD